MEATSSDSASPSKHRHSLGSPGSLIPRNKGRQLPPLFWYMELGDWERATARAKSHPKECRAKAVLRTKSMADDCVTKVAGTKRLALHHACFKLRSAGSAPIPASSLKPKSQQSNIKATEKSEEDPFLAVCRFILLLLEIYPEACQARESRHGCLPLHLAAFASCYIRPPEIDDQPVPSNQMDSSTRSASIPTMGNNKQERVVRPSDADVDRPQIVTVRSLSESTASTVQSTMSAILNEEKFAGAQTRQKKEGGAPPSPNTVGVQPSQSAEEPQNVQPTPKQTIFISNKREQMAVKVLNAMLDAYPRAIRLDSEGGRLPLHTACAGRATPRCVSLLLRAYPAAARHRNKDGFLPLHLAAHWGVSHPNVAITLLRSYPDATVGRNRWERTPLEEALVMAGENGRPHQAALVRALRKHPSYWTRPPKELFQTNNLDERNHASANLVDIDVTLASEDNETSLDDNPNYFNAGHSLLLEDEYEKVTEREEIIEYNEQGGIISRLRRKSSGRQLVANGDLVSLIKGLNWRAVMDRLECNPDEAYQDLVGVMTRGGFSSSSDMTPLHYACERKPPVEVIQALIFSNPEAVMSRMMPGGCLALHFACTWHASPEVVSALLSADPTTAKVVDELGNRPLHSACFSGAEFAVVQDLLSTYPKAVLSRNNQGSQPIDICRRLRHPNRRAVMAAILEKKEYIIAKQNHRRSKSSGSMTGLAQTATKLNERLGSPLANNHSGSNNQMENNDSEPGVEVTYRGEGQGKLLWI